MSELEFIALWQECFNGVPTPLSNATVISFVQWMREADNIALRSQVAELQRQLDEAAKQEPVAWLVNYYEETKGGGKRNVTQASLEPHEPSIMLQFEPDIAERKLIKAEPLYALPPNLPAMIEQARTDEREACARIAKLHISSALRIDNSDGLDNAGDIGECYANSTAEDIETAILARVEKK